MQWNGIDFTLPVSVSFSFAVTASSKIKFYFYLFRPKTAKAPRIKQKWSQTFVNQSQTAIVQGSSVAVRHTDFKLSLPLRLVSLKGLPALCCVSVSFVLM